MSLAVRSITTTAATTKNAKNGTVSMSSLGSSVVVGLGRVWLSVGLVFALTAALLVGSPSQVGAVAGYGDVPEDTWYTDAVQWSTDNGIASMAGFCFGPDALVSRGETAVWIYNMENQPDAGDPHSFSDVTDASQNDAISWMANTGITTGTSRTTFAPDETLKRAEAATFLHRLAGEPSAPPHNFSDVVTGWQQDAVSWMADTGITTGTSPTTFAPEGTLKRAEIVTFLYRYQGEPDVTINTSTPDCEPAQTVVQYTIGDTIAGFPSGFLAASGNFSRASVSITGDGTTITVEINHDGSAAYTNTTYTCTSAGGCTIVNGRVTKGTVNATTMTVTVGAAPAPDLVVDTPTVSTSSPIAGASFTLSATVRNQGNGRSSTTRLRYYRSTDATITTGDMSEGTDYVSGLDAQGSGAESISVTASSTPGTYYYGACVDSTSDESDTTNNCSATVTVTVGAAPAPDLVVDTSTVDVSAPVAGARFTLSATVRNHGNAQSASTRLRYYRSTDATITTGDTRVGTDFVSGLDAQGSGAESISVTASSTPGRYYYGACVDSVSDESDTTNNCSAAVTVTVGAAPAPDLVVDTPTVDVSAPVVGARFTLSATVRNHGSGRSAFTRLRYYRSTDATITTGDMLEGTDLVSGLDAQESGAESISVTASSTPGTYYYGACVDSVSDESDTTNNCSAAVTVTVGAAPAPDLVVDTSTVDVSAPVAGARFTLSATVRNHGNAQSASTRLRYYRSTDATITTGDMSEGTDLVSGLDAQESGAESISVTASSTPGTYYFGACVDSVSDESDTTNNCSAAVTVTVGAAPAPDLVVDTPTVEISAPPAGTRFTLSATVRNQGNAQSASTTLRYYRSAAPTITAADTEVGTDRVYWLEAQESGAESISVTASSTPGTYYYGACVDSVSDESDTTNNCSPAVTVTVGAAPAPDLVVDTPTVDVSAPVAGARFTLSATVRNQGSGRSAFTTLRYYRSTDATITTGDMSEGTDYVSGLDAQESGAESISVTASSTPGRYYYGACVDSTSDESDTTNNCSAAVTVTVGAAPAPDLVVDTPTVDVSAPVAGARFTLSATVRNQGSGRSASTTLRYYRSTDATITTGDMSEGTDYVSGLDAQESGAESISVTASSTPGTYYFGACVDSVSDESDTTNNCSAAVTVTVGAAPAPDLVVDTPTVDVSAPVAGARFTLSATVRNQGNALSASTTLRYYRSADPTITTADTEVGTDFVSGLDAQESEAESISVTASSTPGTYYYGACVDSTSDESDTTNNCSAAVIVTVGAAPAPDLVVDTPTVDISSPTAGASFTLSATVRNLGSGRSAFTTLRYYRSTDATITTGDMSEGTDFVSGLDAQESGAESISVTASSTPGTYYFGACVDSTSDESDTTNNCSAAVTVTVGAAPAPDLVVDTPTVSTSSPAAGASFTLSATVRNQGNGRSAFTTLRYYRSTDATITTGDMSESTDFVSGLDAQGSEAESISVTASSTPGTYYYGACVDSTSDEGDTTNNCSAAVTVTVGAAPAPDLVVDTPTVDISAPVAGARFTLSATVRNQGNALSASTTLRYYRSADPTITTADTEVGTDTVYWLDAQGSEAESISVTASSTPGTYYYGACVDSTPSTSHAPGESETQNNCSSAVTVTVGVAPAPDLVVDTPTVDLSALIAGERFALSVTVDNHQGSAPSAGTTLRFYLSTDATISTGDMGVGASSVGPLGAPGGSVLNIISTAPSISGTFYYGACVDPVHGESDTTNNCSTALKVVIVPDLNVETPTVSDSSPTAGASFTLSSTVWNLGNILSAPTTLRYYRSTDSTITTSDTEVGTVQVDGLHTRRGEGEPVSLTAPLDPGAYYYGVCVDSVVGETDTANNCSAAVIVTVGAAPDLAVDTPTASESAPAVSSSFTLSVTVRNQGDAPSASTTLRYYASIDTNVYPELPATTFLEVPFHTDDVGDLAPSGSSTHSISVRTWDTGTTRYYRACVGSVTDEANTANNCSAPVAVYVTGTPDLVVDAPTANDDSPIAAGSSFSLSTTVRNRGNGSVPAATVFYYRSTDSTISTNDQQVASVQVSGVRAYGTSLVSATLTASVAPGTYYYGACVGLVEGESNATNNCSTAVTVTVVPAPGPDLVVDTPTTYGIQPAFGAFFWLYATVRNQGADPSTPATLLFYRSTDSTITTSDERIGSGSSIRGLSPAETAFLSDSSRAPSTSGTYYYGACVVSSRDESNTVNNCSPALTIVLGQPDLVVDTPLVDLGSVDAGKEFGLTIVVRNQGTGTSPYTTLRYYLSTDSTITSEDTSLRTDSVSTVGSSDSRRVPSLQQVPSTAGTYYYGVCVDSVPEELSTTNNCSAVVQVTVEPADLVILVPTLITFRHRPPDEFELRVSVLNRGNLPSVSTTLRYYRSSDATITSADTPVGTDSVGNLSPHRSSLQGVVLTEPSAAGTYYYGACVDAIGNESTTNNCSEAVMVTVGAVQPPALTLRLTECFVFQNQHFVMFKVTAHVSVSSLVVKTYQVEGRNNTKHLMATINVGNLAAGNSYTKLTSRYFPANLRRNLPNCTADLAWDNGTATPNFGLATTEVPDLPPPDPTDTPVPPADRPPTLSQVFHLWLSLDRALYDQYTDCGFSGRPPCPNQDHIAWWSQLPAHLRQLATRP